MPLLVKFKSQINTESDRIFITDLTGEYVVTDNEGGYGVSGTPNFDLDTLALLAIVQRNASTGITTLPAVGQSFIHNSNFENNQSSIFEFVYEADGWHTMNLVVLPVSVNHNTDLNTNDLFVGNNFFFTGDGLIHIKTGLDESDVVEDLTTVLTQESLSKTTCEEFFQGQLSIAREEKYAEYRRRRKGVCKPDREFNEIRELTEDIISADLTFRSGLTVQAQDQVEVLLDEQNV